MCVHNTHTLIHAHTTHRHIYIYTGIQIHIFTLSHTYIDMYIHAYIHTIHLFTQFTHTHSFTCVCHKHMH